jgi:hypothetical protein
MGPIRREPLDGDDLLAYGGRHIHVAGLLGMPIHEHSARNAQEHNQKVHDQTVNAESGSVAFGHEEISALAHEHWRARGCPEGSSNKDWFRATRELQARNA